MFAAHQNHLSPPHSPPAGSYLKTISGCFPMSLWLIWNCIAQQTASTTQLTFSSRFFDTVNGPDKKNWRTNKMAMRGFCHPDSMSNIIHANLRPCLAKFFYPLLLSNSESEASGKCSIINSLARLNQTLHHLSPQRTIQLPIDYLI